MAHHHWVHDRVALIVSPAISYVKAANFLVKYSRLRIIFILMDRSKGLNTEQQSIVRSFWSIKIQSFFSVLEGKMYLKHSRTNDKTLFSLADPKIMKQTFIFYHD